MLHSMEPSGLKKSKRTVIHIYIYANIPCNAVPDAREMRFASNA